jgi:N-acetylneuraminic acid mutarotase
VKFIFGVLCFLTQLAIGQDLAWKELADLPRPVAGYMGVAIQGKYLVIGGSYWENEKKYWTGLVQSFDPENNTWKNEGSLPAPRSDAAFAVLKDRTYIFGGGANGEITTDALVLANNQWKALPGAALPEPRRYSAAVSAGKYIYLLGGMFKDNDYTTVTNTFWRWRPGLKKWEVLAPLPGPARINHVMTTIGNSIYVFTGGTTAPANDVANLNDVYKYDLDTHSWTRLPDLPVHNRAWSAVSVGERVLLIGGYTDKFARDVALYDPRTGSFSMLAPLPLGICDARFVRIGNRVMGAGGEVGDHIRGKETVLTDLPTSLIKSKKVHQK